jgi:hypothetical protein
MKKFCQEKLAKRDFLQRTMTSDFYQLIQAQPKGGLLTIRCPGRQDKNLILESDISIILATLDCDFQVVHDSSISSLAQIQQSTPYDTNEPIIILAYDIPGQNGRLAQIYVVLSITICITIFALGLLGALAVTVGRFLNKYKPVRLPQDFQESSQNNLEISDILACHSRPQSSGSDNESKVGPLHVQVHQ